MSSIAPGKAPERPTRRQTQAIPTHMQAAIRKVYGGPEVLTIEQVAAPGLKDRDVLVRVRAVTGVLIPNSMAGNRWFASIGRVLRAIVMSPFLRQSLRRFFSVPKKTDLLALIGLIESGKVAPVIDSTHPLGDAQAAIVRQGEGHARGKVVITL